MIENNQLPEPLFWPQTLQILEHNLADDDFRLQMLKLSIAVDILAQLRSGKIGGQHHASRFKRYLILHGLLTEQEAEFWYQCRSALVHNFGALGHDTGAAPLRFAFIHHSAQPLFHKVGTRLQVNLFKVTAVYGLAKTNFMAHLNNSESARLRFAQVFKFIGNIDKS